ncbi:UDP-galactopyranose mutase [Citrobacter freundii]|nr:UDP-galactopyranose mutase [Citrobacter freundii]
MKYDFLIVGAGLYGATCAYELTKKGKRVLVIDKRNHVGGNIYTENVDGIYVHKYGAHIFHTNDKTIWDYVNSFVEFNRFTNSPLAYYQGRLYNLPFNMNTFYQLWGTITPEDARNEIARQRGEMSGKVPENLEEQAISLVGRDIYERLIKGYTEKQWGRKTTELPAFIINRIPVRFTYDNNYFSDRYQGIPIGGYTAIVEKMLLNVDVELNVDYLEKKEHYDNLAERVIYTGPIDAYFNYCHGTLEYRSLRFENEYLNNISDYQGNAVVNYTDADVKFTRIIEHKHFQPVDCEHTIITKEYPQEWTPADEAYYPINDQKNMELYHQYRKLAKGENVLFGGRLAEYKYYDMHQIIRSAFTLLEKI